jgi:hypothetical protein
MPDTETFPSDAAEVIAVSKQAVALQPVDLDVLEVPSAHANVKGSQTGSFRSQGFMEETGVERKVAHAAANGRKASIFRITEKGRRELPKMLAGHRVGGMARPSLGGRGVGSSPLASSVSGESGAGTDSPDHLPGTEPTGFDHLKDAA